MRTRVAVLLATAAAVATLLAGCAGEQDAPLVGNDDVGTLSRPTAPPAIDGPASTQVPVTVLDDGDGPELCLGGVAESYPPQCGGPPLLDWDWPTVGHFEEASGVRWGSYHVTGTFDGTSFTATDVIPAALYDAMPLPEQTPTPSDLSDDELRSIADTIVYLPVTLSSGVVDGVVTVGVAADDGSIQAWVDQEYGKGVVVVYPALAPVG